MFWALICNVAYNLSDWSINASFWYVELLSKKKTLKSQFRINFHFNKSWGKIFKFEIKKKLEEKE